MNDQPNLEDFLEADSAPLGPKHSLEEPYKPEKHSLELAYHEAGHFIMDCLVEKLDIGFTEVIETKIIVNEDIVKGNVEIRKNPKMRDKVEEREFYQQMLRRGACRILVLCAGYATYLKHIDRAEYYIGVYTTDKVNRYRLKNFPTYDPNFDYMKIETLLSHYGVKRRKSVLEIIERVNNELIKIMSCAPIRCSLGFVKNKLLRNNGVAINGNPVAKMISRVNRHTKNFSLSSVLQRIEALIIEHKEI